MLVTSWCWWLTHFVSNTRHQHIDVTGWKLFWLNEYIWPLLWFMRRNLSLNRLCFGDFKNFSSCKNPWVRREDDVESFFSFGTQSNTQSHCQFLRESCSDFRFGFSGKTVASDRFIQISKKRDTYSEGIRRELTGQLLSEKFSAKTNRGSLKEFIMNSNDLKQKSGCQFGGE